MKIQKSHIFGVILGLTPVVVLYFALECRPFAKANQTAKQKNSIPLISEPYAASVDDLRFVELQIEAVTIDMYRYLGWFPDEKEILKKASVKAIDNLEVIRDYLQQLDFTGQLIELKKSNLANIDKLIQIYDGIELKSTDDIKKAFAEFNDVYSQYSEKLGKSIKENQPVVKLPEDFDPGEEEIKFAQNQQDRQAYLDAVKLIKEKKFDQAYKDLAGLRLHKTQNVRLSAYCRP